MENRFVIDNISVTECTVFFSFLRLRCYIGAELGAPSAAELACADESGTSNQAQTVTIAFDRERNQHCIEVQALIDRNVFPDKYALILTLGGEKIAIQAIDLVAREMAAYARSSLHEFKLMIEGRKASNPWNRPKLLDIGGRARSGVLYGKGFEDCDVTVLDIRSDVGVDVVGDIHAMDRVLARESFDLILCVSVFEHLMMPWKAALQINHVLRPGGLALIQTHQTVGMHDIPWDYYRFSDACWPGLFNEETGFVIRETLMNQFVHVVPQHYHVSAPGLENAGGFLESSVIVEKIGTTDLAWPVELSDIVQTHYPG